MSATGWESCVFHHESQDGDCVLSPDQAQQPCPQDSYLHITEDGLCQLVITNIQVSRESNIYKIFSSGKVTNSIRMFITEVGIARWPLT